jgi:hypothetical protein
MIKFADGSVSSLPGVNLHVGQEVEVLRYWSGMGEVIGFWEKSGEVRVRMLTGPEKGWEGAFDVKDVRALKVPNAAPSGEPGNLLTEMRVTKIKRSAQGTSLKVYGEVTGEHGKSYRFGYIRRSNFRGWLCTCDSFILSLFKKNRNCKHIKLVRAQYGRYGQKVN